MNTIKHMSMNIQGLIRNTGKRSMKGFFTDENGKQLSDKEAREYLDECLEKGWRVIPMSDKCKNFDYQDGCQCWKKQEGQK